MCHQALSKGHQWALSLSHQPPKHFFSHQVPTPVIYGIWCEKKCGASPKRWKGQSAYRWLRFSAR